MKTLFLLIIFLCGTSLLAQNDNIIQNSIRLNALALLENYYEIQYERVIGAKNSIKIGFGTGKPINNSGSDADKDFMEAFGTNSFNNQNEHIVKGFSINADYRYFFADKIAPKGLYVSPGVQYLKFNEKYTYVNTNEGGFRTLVDNDYSLVNIRAMVGYQFIFAKSIVVNPYLGGGVALGKVENPTTRVEAYGSGFNLNLGLDVGLGF